ncbi:DUF397 domain-containing protein [Micromonospora humi]|uniref:DUF397 domain-containing protein n=1 Tax=Micromonospora humi TaxID=745366 RepID=A0A1C5IBB7_9ACTN|nr:protein of unknown function [Micromonospora humi]
MPTDASALGPQRKPDRASEVGEERGGSCAAGSRARKATRSGNTDCMEVADNLPGVVLVRVSKDHEAGTLRVSPASWRAFVALAKHLGPAA